MSEREKKIRIHCSGERFNVSAVDVLYLLGVIDVIRGDRRQMGKQREEMDKSFEKLKSAVDTIPAAVMLAGGPPYRLTFTEACLKEIMESQK